MPLTDGSARGHNLIWIKQGRNRNPVNKNRFPFPTVPHRLELASADEAPDDPQARQERALASMRLLEKEHLYLDLADTFRALADGSRAKILHSLLHQELCTEDLADIVGISQPAVSQHLRLLRTRQVVKGRRVGRRVFYSLDDAHIRDLLSLTLSHLRHQQSTGVAAGGHAPGKDGTLRGRPTGPEGGVRPR